ncbi:MAG: hypothetical protein ACOYNF_04015 [Rhodoferax sp.]
MTASSFTKMQAIPPLQSSALGAKVCCPESIAPPTIGGAASQGTSKASPGSGKKCTATLSPENRTDTNPPSLSISISMALL